MNGEKKDFCVLLWSKKDITIDNIDLKRSIESEAPGAEVHIVNLDDLRQMEIAALKSLLDHYSKKKCTHYQFLRGSRKNGFLETWLYHGKSVYHW